MENLNAENIINEIQSLIKALKDCGGWVKRGNGEGWFNHEILADALALINSQKQRIEELVEDKMRLQHELLTDTYRSRRIRVDAIRADIVMEIKTRFAMRFGTYTDKDMTPIDEVFRLLDQIVEEILEAHE